MDEQPRRRRQQAEQLKDTAPVQPPVEDHDILAPNEDAAPPEVDPWEDLPPYEPPQRERDPSPRNESPHTREDQRKPHSFRLSDVPSYAKSFLILILSYAFAFIKKIRLSIKGAKGKKWPVIVSVALSLALLGLLVNAILSGPDVMPVPDPEETVAPVAEVQPTFNAPTDATEETAAQGDIVASPATAPTSMSTPIITIGQGNAAAQETTPPVDAMFKKGDSGDHIALMQAALIELGYLDGEADGEFGNGTRDAVRSFQSANDLASDGVAGEQTLMLLFSGTAKAAPAASPAP